MTPLTEEHIEYLLKGLPHYQPGKWAKYLFYGRLFSLFLRKKMREFGSAVTLKRALASGLLLGLMLPVIGTFFSMKPSVARGHFLYPLKRAVEQIELFLTTEPIARAKTYLKFSDRRASEVKTILSSEVSSRTMEQTIAETLGDVLAEYDAAIILVGAETDTKRVLDALNAIERTQNDHVVAFGALTKPNPLEDPLREELEDALLETQQKQGNVVAAKTKVEILAWQGKDTVEFNVEDKTLSGGLERLRSEAQEVLQRTEDDFRALGLPSGKREGQLHSIIREKLSEAKTAFQNENYGKALGLGEASSVIIHQLDPSIQNAE